jgi:peptidoglycan hydrolase-like protein with peptidoglycan-binding domain
MIGMQIIRLIIHFRRLVDQPVFQGFPPTAASNTGETAMHKCLATLTLSVMLAVPLVASAAGGGRTPGSLPAAVDQMLAQDMIQLAQTTPKMAGFDPGRVNGVFDAQTATALRQYQAAHSLPVSGLLDEPTRRVLLPGNDEADEG